MAFEEENPLLYFVIRRDDFGLGVPRIVFETEHLHEAQAKYKELSDGCDSKEIIHRIETYGRKGWTRGSLFK